MPRFDATYVPPSVMTIFAHPDDTEFSCGATLATWARAGCDITLVLCTSGNAGTHDTAFTQSSLAETRAAEQRAAADAMGVKTVIGLRHDDCALQPTLDLRREIVGLIRQYRPQVVICGDPTAWFYETRYINHPDHRAAAQAAVEAVFPCSEMELLWPDLGPVHKVHAVYISGQQQDTTYIDVTDGMDAKLAALKCHGSQFGDWDPTEMIREWATRDAKSARKLAKKAKKAKKSTANDTATWPGGSPTPSFPPGKPKFVEGFHVMVLKADEDPPPVDAVPA